MGIKFKEPQGHINNTIFTKIEMIKIYVIFLVTTAIAPQNTETNKKNRSQKYVSWLQKRHFQCKHDHYIYEYSSRIHHTHTQLTCCPFGWPNLATPTIKQSFNVNNKKASKQITFYEKWSVCVSKNAPKSDKSEWKGEKNSVCVDKKCFSMEDFPNTKHEKSKSCSVRSWNDSFQQYPYYTTTESIEMIHIICMTLFLWWHVSSPPPSPFPFNSNNARCYERCVTHRSNRQLFQFVYM